MVSCLGPFRRLAPAEPSQDAPLSLAAPVSVAAAAVHVGLEHFSQGQDPVASVDAPDVVAEASAEVRQHVHPALAVAPVSLHVQPVELAVDAVAAQHVAAVARHVAARVVYRRPVVVVVQRAAVAAAAQPEQAPAMFAARRLDPCLGPDARHEP